MLVAVLALLAAGCGGGGGGGGGGESTSASGGGKKIKVCLITDIGGLNDRSFNFLANKGLQDAKSQLGVETRVIQSQQNSDYIPNLQTCGQAGYDLIVSVGFLMGDATHKAAQAFPKSNFAIIDFAYSPDQALKNLQGLVFQEEQPGYLAVYLAGLTTKTNVVSSVGGQKIPPVDHYIAGYEAGAKDANPNVKTIHGYSQSFTDQAACKEIALDQISKKSDIVFQVAGQCGLGALDAAKEKGVWGIGVDADQAYLGPHILTSALKRVDVAVFKTIQATQDGKFKGGGVTVFNLSNDGVGLGKTSSKVPQDVLDKLKAQQDKVKNGDVKVPNTVK